VKTEFGFHVIRVDDTRPLKFPSADEFMADREARARLMRQMQDEKLNTMVKDLRAKAKIDVK
jgi:peptidyl-prolyl cis-trans isomerase C